jgi:hypothetical protein
MKALLIGAGLLALAASIEQANAMPRQPLQMPTVSPQDVTTVYFRGGFYTAGGFYYYNGYRGALGFRPGYHYYRGYWFPATVFAAGVTIGTLSAPLPPTRYAAAHVQWCYAHYASYREWDDTFLAYTGLRWHCLSPYD